MNTSFPTLFIWIAVGSLTPVVRLPKMADRSPDELRLSEQSKWWALCIGALELCLPFCLKPEFNSELFSARKLFKTKWNR